MEYDNRRQLLLKKDNCIPTLLTTGAKFTRFLTNKKHQNHYQENGQNLYIYPIAERIIITLLLDMLRTFTEHIAIQIGRYLQNESVLVTGGGVHLTNS